jgi:hypothetical protein
LFQRWGLIVLMPVMLIIAYGRQLALTIENAKRDPSLG